jgi:hypothetical protein
MTLAAFAALALTWVKWTQRLRTFPVSGTVSCNGQPVGSGKIVFLPPNPAGQQATSQIIGGKFSLTTFAHNDGAIPGSYDVVIVSPSVPAKYRSQVTSGVTARVQNGGNFMALDLR